MPGAKEQKCRSRGCFKLARWKCMVVMPTPPGMPRTQVGNGSGLTIDGERARLFSGVCVCDAHRAEATIAQVLGPVGYQAISYAFKILKKRPPAMDDLGVDFESLEHAPILTH